MAQLIESNTKRGTTHKKKHTEKKKNGQSELVLATTIPTLTERSENVDKQHEK